MNLSYLSEPAENSYIIDVESGVESARLMQLEMLEETFTCLSFGLTAWARVPQTPLQDAQQAIVAEPELA